jgi:hypothetical protein
MPVLFLSHSGADTEAARALKKRIEDSPAAKEAGLKVWFVLSSQADIPSS